MNGRRRLPLNALRAFEAVGHHLSFTAGAQALHVTQSALSRHVASLEQLLNCKLLERKPQGLALTPAGAALLPVIRQSFDSLDRMINAILRDGTGLRALRVHMPPSFLQHMALPLLKDFRQAFPNVPLDLSSSSATGLPSRDFDIAVAYDRPRQDEAVRDLLWRVAVTPLCTPEIARGREGLGLADFLARNELLHVRLDGQPRGILWESFAAQIGFPLDAERGLAFDTASLAVQYAQSGAGVVLADRHMFAGLIAAGSLVQPFAATCDDGYGYYLVCNPRDVTEPGIALFRAWMIDRFSGPDRDTGAAEDRRETAPE